MLRAISNPISVRIIRIIEEHEEITVLGIAQACGSKYPISQAVISQKLAELRRYKVVKFNRMGRYRFYSMNHTTIKRINRVSSELARISENQYA